MKEKKIYFKFIPRRKRAWRYASVLLSHVDHIEEVQDVQDADNFLDGSEYIEHLANIYNGLEDWAVIEIVEVEADSGDIEFRENDKAPTVKERERLERKIKRLKKETEKIEKQTAEFKAIAETERVKAEAIKKETEELRQENIRILIDDWGLTPDEAEYAEKNMQRYMKQFWKVTPDQIRLEYANLTKGKAEADKLKNEINEENRKEVHAESESTKDYIRVLDVYVPYHLYYDYIVHITKDVKSHELDKFEARRCILHQRLYDVFGLDRVSDRETKESKALNRVINRVRTCFVCDSDTNGKDVCFKCGTQNNIGTYLNKLNKLKVAKP